MRNEQPASTTWKTVVAWLRLAWVLFAGMIGSIVGLMPTVENGARYSHIIEFSFWFGMIAAAIPAVYWSLSALDRDQKVDKKREATSSAIFGICVAVPIGFALYVFTHLTV
jgi:hypothetical protein